MTHTRAVEISKLSAHGNSAIPDIVTVVVDDWRGTQVKHHIEQQAIQIAQDNIDVAHNVTKIHATAGGWDIDAVVLSQDDGDTMAELFSADAWDWNEDESKVTYYRDVETDVQEEIRERTEEALLDEIASEIPFKRDMLDLGSVTIREQFCDKARFDI